MIRRFGGSTKSGGSLYELSSFAFERTLSIDLWLCVHLEAGTHDLYEILGHIIQFGAIIVCTISVY